MIHISIIFICLYMNDLSRYSKCMQVTHIGTTTRMGNVSVFSPVKEGAEAQEVFLVFKIFYE